MKKNVWTVLAAIAAVAMLVAVCVSIFKGGCTALIDAGDKQLPMKCHWAFIASKIMGVGGVVVALVAMLAKTKEARIISSLGIIVTAVCTMAVISPMGIGICMKPEMICHQTAPLVYGACVVAIVVALVMLVKADPAKAELPKMDV